MRTVIVFTCTLVFAVLPVSGAGADSAELATPSITVAPPEITNSQSAHFEFSSLDDGVTFSCSLDGEAFSPCETPKEYQSLDERPHTFAVKTSRDGVESKSATHGWVIDRTPPAVSLASPADGSATSDDTPSFEGFGGTVEGDEPVVTIKVWAGSDTSAEPVFELGPVELDTGIWSAAVDEPIPAGMYLAQVEQVDAAGNLGVWAVSFAVDTAEPVFVGVAASQIVEQTGPSGAVATFGTPAVDELDPAPKVDCSPPSGAVFPAGVTTVSCRATDWAGNSAETQFTVTVANTTRPAAVQGLRAQAARSRVGLSWKSPADWDYDRLVVRRTPREASMWSVVYEGRSATTFTDRNVQNDTEYVYEAVIYDSAGNVSASVATGARPSAILSPRWNAVWKGPRLLRWAAVRKADYYNVQLWRNGRKILSRWPTRARFTLQKRWRHAGRRYSLADGTYFVYVWPGFGPKAATRYGRVVGWTKFRVK